MIDLPDYDIGDKWIIAQRGKKNKVEFNKPYLFFQEEEPGLSGKLEKVNSIFLTNSECPFKCLMCDLWKNTTDTPIGSGYIPKQIEYALSNLDDAKSIKLYNSGNFFDIKAITPVDYKAIADTLTGYENVIVESHPKLLGDLCLQFNQLVKGKLQVAMGLETIHPDVMPLLNKRMDLDEFQDAVTFLKENNIASRAFILLKPPFLSEVEGIDWAKRSIEFAFDAGIDICSVIPTRPGNGALEKLQVEGYFEPPDISSLEDVLEYGIGLKRGIVLADLWDIGQFSKCNKCLDARFARINAMNLTQEVENNVECNCQNP